MEITRDIAISFEQESLIDMHSVLNALNLLALELTLIERTVPDVRQVKLVLQELYRIGQHLRSKELAHHEAAQADGFIVRVREAVAAARLQVDSRDPAAGELERSALNIESILTVYRVRAREIDARGQDMCSWVTHNIAELQHNFRVFFEALQRNSKGAYHIARRSAEHRSGDYLIQLHIDSGDGARLSMPAVFQDILRDLIANARKYTHPGGTIRADLYSAANELRCVVEDTGVGIPEGEIEQVVVFGKRGRNVQDHPTRGGGFGLTKAYYVTRRCGGRMWIDSEIGSGTRIEIRLPRPQESKRAG